MKFVKSLFAVAVASAVLGAQAADFTVDAKSNSTTGGSGVSTLTFSAGQQFTVSVNLSDLWNAGELPRWSNANGLNQSLTFGSGTDEEVKAWRPAIANGTVIGDSWSNDYTQGGLTADYGTLVGQFDSGNFFKIGTNYSGTVANAGTLKLFYFDSNSGDNYGSIVATVTAVPEPETYAMMLAGLGLMGAIARRRKSKAA